MSQLLESERRHEDARAELHATMMKDFCTVLRRSGLPTMVVMRLAALSLGAIYREVADAHLEPETCPCGWRPQENSDIELLCCALATACRRRDSATLATMSVAGSA